mgnify:CR=1 FL=1
MDWIKERLQEPSSYGAMGAIVMASGIIFNQPLLIWGGIVGGTIAFIMKEKGEFWIGSVDFISRSKDLLYSQRRRGGNL